MGILILVMLLCLATTSASSGHAARIIEESGGQDLSSSSSSSSKTHLNINGRNNRRVIDVKGGPESVVWVVQLSDLHFSVHNPDRALDFKNIVGPALSMINPSLVLITGDLTGLPSFLALPLLPKYSLWVWLNFMFWVSCAQLLRSIYYVIVVLGIMGFFLLLSICLKFWLSPEFFFFFELIRNGNSCMRFFIMFVHVLEFHVSVSILRYFQIWLIRNKSHPKF